MCVLPILNRMSVSTSEIGNPYLIELNQKTAASSTDTTYILVFRCCISVSQRGVCCGLLFAKLCHRTFALLAAALRLLQPVLWRVEMQLLYSIRGLWGAVERASAFRIYTL